MALEIERIKAICFDVDGTLRDTDDLYVKKFAKKLAAIRFALPGRDENHAARRLVMFLEEPMNRFYSTLDRFHLDDDFVWLRTRKQKAHNPEDLHIITGVKEMLTTLANLYPLAVVTSRDEAGTKAFLDHHELTPFFQCMATALTTRYTKPHPQPVIWAAEQLGVQPSHCLMVGDTTVDIRSGRRAGAQTVGVLCGFGEQEELIKHGANLVLDTTATLKNILV